MATKKPVTISIPKHGMVLTESIHSEAFMMHPHVDNYHQVVFVLSGKVDVYTDLSDQDWSVSAGSLYFIPKGVSHRIRDIEPATLWLLAMSDDLVAGHSQLKSIWSGLETVKTPVLKPSPIYLNLFEASLRRILVEQTQQKVGSELAIHAEAGRLLVVLARLVDMQSNTDSLSRVRQVYDRMRESFYEDWDLDAAALEADLSRRRFSEIFKEITGGTFLAGLTEMRLSHAATLLKEKRHTIAGVAFSSGFGDISHFYRVFKAHYGVPPGQWGE